MKKVKENIAVDVFSLDQLAIMQYLVHGSSLKHNFRSPFRNDNGPGCWLSEHNGKLYYHDPRDPVHNGKHMVDLWMVLHNVSYVEAVHGILKFSGKQKPTKRTSYKKARIAKFDFAFREWEDYDAELWLPYGLTIPDLEPDLRPIAYYEYESTEFKGKVRIVSRPSLPLYIYLFESGGSKVYGPRSKPKFFSQCSAEDLYIYRKGSATLFITASGKDAKVVFKETPFDTTAQNGEMFLLSEALVKLAKDYENIIVSNDGDMAGLNANNRLGQALANRLNKEVMVIDFPYEYKDYARAKKLLGGDYFGFINKLMNERRSILPKEDSGIIPS